MKITKDSDYVIVKDARKPVREDLTEVELQKWGTPSFLNYLSKRVLTKKIAGKPSSDPLTKKPVGIRSELKRKTAVDGRPKEKGIKIMVGQGYGL